MKKLNTLKIFGTIILVLGAISMIAPFLQMIIMSITNNPTSTQNVLSTGDFTLKNYQTVFSELPMIRYFLNSFFVTTTTVLGQICCATLSGYALVKLNIHHKNILFFIILTTMMLPIQVNIIPLFFIMKKLNWLNTYQALIIPGFFGGFGIFLMRQWFLGLPKEIEDAAMIDGCNIIQRFTKIIIPMSLPAIASLSVFTFITTWNSFMWPLIATSSTQLRTLPVGLSEFKNSFVELTNWGELTTCCVITTIPAVIVFLIGKKYFINNLLQGSSK